MSKLKIKFFVAIIMSALFVQQADAAKVVPARQPIAKITVADAQDASLYKETDIIKKVSFKNKLKRSGESEIITFIKKYNNYMMKNDFDKLNDFYTEDYINNDGFDKKTMFEMMKGSSETYKDMKYETEILSIKVSGNYAEVTIKETANGSTSVPVKSINEYGDICSVVEYTDYLRKENNSWKISATTVHSEEVSLLYGEAKYMSVDLTSPEAVPEGSEYEVGIKTVLPGGSFVVGSIINEEIVYPQDTKKDVFRSVKSDELIRVLKSNKNGHNEYATVSIGITRARVEPPQVMIDMTGVAFFMKRINVVPKVRNIKGVK